MHDFRVALLEHPAIMAGMNTDQIQHFKKKLLGELTAVEEELRSLGWKNQSGEWEAAATDIDQTATEQDELADRMEEYQENRAEIEEIQIHWDAIKKALEKIENGVFGMCEIEGEPIEEERLNANASARTCIKHLGEEEKN